MSRSATVTGVNTGADDSVTVNTMFPAFSGADALATEADGQAALVRETRGELGRVAERDIRCGRGDLRTRRCRTRDRRLERHVPEPLVVTVVDPK